MVRGLVTIALMSCAMAFAGESSSSSDVFSSGFLGLPDTLSQELQTVASEGFWHGFRLATVVMLSTGALSVVLHLINRGAGR